jgi:hypothetical protein
MMGDVVPKKVESFQFREQATACLRRKLRQVMREQLARWSDLISVGCHALRSQCRTPRAGWQKTPVPAGLDGRSPQSLDCTICGPPGRWRTISPTLGRSFEHCVNFWMGMNPGLACVQGRLRCRRAGATDNFAACPSEIDAPYGAVPPAGSIASGSGMRRPGLLPKLRTRAVARSSRFSRGRRRSSHPAFS